jgi:hypothetical protein
MVDELAFQSGEEALDGLTPFAFANRLMTGHNAYGLQQ